MRSSPAVSLTFALLALSGCTNLSQDGNNVGAQGGVDEATSALTLPPGLDLLSPSWEMASHDGFAHNNNATEFRIRASTVGSLGVEWKALGTDNNGTIVALGLSQSDGE